MKYELNNSFFLCWVQRRYRKTGPSDCPFSWSLNPIISGLWWYIFIVLLLCTPRCVTAWMKGKSGHLPPTQIMLRVVRLCWGLLSWPRTVTQAMTKPYHVTCWGLLMIAQVWLDYSNFWSTSACSIIFLQAVLFSYFPPTHLVSCVYGAGRRDKTPGSLICRPETTKAWKENTRF